MAHAVRRGAIATASDSGTVVEVPAYPHRLTQLDGGARIVTAPMRERSSATLWFMFSVGSRWETEANAGIAHFIEHMVFKGGERYRDARAVSEAVEEVGGVLNASTDREATIFWAKVPATYIDTAVDVLTDILLKPAFDADEIEKEKLVVVEELRMYQDSPQDYVQTIFDEVMWPGHPLGRDVAGTETAVLGFNAELCKQQLHHHYRPGTVVVCATGAIDSDHVEDVVGEKLRGWHGDKSDRGVPQPAQHLDKPEFRLVNRRVEQSAIILGLRAPGYLDADRHVIDILNCILGEGMSSRLFLELREQQALAYDVSSYTTKLRDSGALCIALGCDPSRSAAAVTSAKREVERLAEADVTAAELEKAKAYTKGRLVVQLESTSALGNYYGQQELLLGEMVKPSVLLERVAAVSAADIRRVASALLDPKNGGWRGAAVAPVRGASKLEEAFFAPSTV